MQDKLISRLSSYEVKKLNFHYLHYKFFNRDLIKVINTYATGKVMDIGCGNKPYEKIFEGKITEYIGCDIVQSDKQKVDIICKADTIPLPDESFDTLFSTQVIEHVEDHQALVNEAYRLLKKGQYFIVSGPMYWPIHGDPYDFFRFTKHGFEQVLEKAGFEVVDVVSNGGMWATTGQSIIHSFINSKSKNFFVRFSRSVFFRLRIYWVINTFFSWLDKVDYNPVFTMNYIVVGKK